MTIKTKTGVGVTFSVEGFHNFPVAEQMFGQEVSFLQHRHRHMFQFDCKRRVFHDDRDVEFILMKREIQQHVFDTWGYPAEFGAMSCEMIARDLLGVFGLYYCKVSEDGENYAEVESEE